METTVTHDSAFSSPFRIPEEEKNMLFLSVYIQHYPLDNQLLLQTDLESFLVHNTRYQNKMVSFCPTFRRHFRWEIGSKLKSLKCKIKFGKYCLFVFIERNPFPVICNHPFGCPLHTDIFTGIQS